MAPPWPRPWPRLGSRLPPPSRPVVRKEHAPGARAPARTPPPSAHALPRAYRVPCRWQLLYPPPSPAARRQAVHAASRTASRATRRRDHSTTCLEKPMRRRGESTDCPHREAAGRSSRNPSLLRPEVLGILPPAAGRCLASREWLVDSRLTKSVPKVVCLGFATLLQPLVQGRHALLSFLVIGY